MKNPEVNFEYKTPAQRLKATEQKPCNLWIPNAGRPTEHQAVQVLQGWRNLLGIV